MSIIGAIAGSLGLSEAAVKLGGKVLGFVGAGIAIALVVDAIGDSRENEIRLEGAETTLENQGEADDTDAALEDADQADDERLEDVIDEAADKNPESAGSSVGAASNAAHDELRRQAGTR